MVKNVVIVGGGGAGVAAAVALAPKLNPSQHQLILISERPFHTHMPAAIRVNVTGDGQLEDKLFLPLSKLFSDKRRGQFIHARAERVDNANVYLDNGEAVPYAVLVLATGNVWRGMLQFPRTLEETIGSVTSWRSKFAKAKSVLIIGGGSVGAELAGEIREYYPKTSVTILHAERHLLNAAYPDSFRQRLDAQFQKVGVRLVLDDVALDLPSDPLEEIHGPVRTKNGKTLDADLIVLATGGRPNASLAQTLDVSIVSESGRVKVLPTLQVPLASGARNVFAAGDIIEWQEQHTLVKAGGHAGIIAPNVLAVLNGTAPTKLYKTPAEIIVVTRGKSGGLGFADFLCGLTFPAWLVAKMKGGTLFTEMAAKNFS